MSILPDDYEIPQKAGNYMKLEDGENKFRILDNPVLGWEYWVTEKDGKRKPVRKHMGEEIQAEDLEEGEQLKHFWAMPVFNYKDERVQILELTQKSIQKAIKALDRSKDWGSALGYDLLVTKSGQKLDTEYVVVPAPPKKLAPAIEQLHKDMEINMEALFTGDDPFKSDKTEAEKEAFLDEVDKAIS